MNNRIVVCFGSDKTAGELNTDILPLDELLNDFSFHVPFSLLCSICSLNIPQSLVETIQGEPGVGFQNIFFLPSTIIIPAENNKKTEEKELHNN